jgi:hypothetical protein
MEKGTPLIYRLIDGHARQKDPGLWVGSACWLVPLDEGIQKQRYHMTTKGEIK